MLFLHPYHFRCTANPLIKNSSIVRAYTSCMRFNCMLYCNTVLMVSASFCSSLSRAVHVGSVA
ncbi:hypothetical protein EVA_05014 [gut metagenome]|uniref:Uncharacterized protein n=1 Tax=gut metagenome TaxID=749906 RepID=J9H0N2_9ZZZZ